MNRKILLLLSLAVLALVIGVSLYATQITGTKNAITTFEECASAGYPIRESYPEVCAVPDGETFTKQYPRQDTINEEDAGQDTNNASAAQQEAIRQAKQYQPEGMCAQVMTPATHTSTGARYTFSSSCLPEGWRADR